MSYTFTIKQLFGACLARVSGESMRPHFAPDDFVLGLRWPGMHLRVGQAVLARHPSLGLLIKRVAHISSEGARLSGDNTQSTSSVDLGVVPAARLLRVCWHFRGAARTCPENA